MQFSIVSYAQFSLASGEDFGSFPFEKHGFPIGLLVYNPETNERDFSLFSSYIKDYDTSVDPNFIYPYFHTIRKEFQASKDDLKTFVDNFNDKYFKLLPVISI